jgi:hypothetical protein
LNTDSSPYGQNLVSKENKELVEKILNLMGNYEIFIRNGFRNGLYSDIFKNIVEHECISYLKGITIPGLNISDEKEDIKKYDSFLLENTGILQKLTNDWNNNSNVSNKSVIKQQWKDKKDKVDNKINEINTQIKKFLTKLGKNETTNTLIENPPKKDENTKNVYSIYLILFLYKTVFTMVKEYYERKIEEIDKNNVRGGGKTQKYSQTQKHNKTHKNHK